MVSQVAYYQNMWLPGLKVKCIVNHLTNTLQIALYLENSWNENFKVQMKQLVSFCDEYSAIELGRGGGGLKHGGKWFTMVTAVSYQT